MGRGVDARSCSLLAFGGAGPMIACQLANEIGIRSVVVPARSSGLSALGCLTANPSFTRIRTVRIKESEFDAQAFAIVLEELEQLILAELEGTIAARTNVDTGHSALMRYAGQSYEIEVPAKPHLTSLNLSELFAQKHRDVYGYQLNSPWECVAIRTTITEKRDPSVFLQSERSSGSTDGTKAIRAFFPSFGWREAAEINRGGNLSNVIGPAIIVDDFSTIVVPPDWNARSGNGGHIRIDYAGN